MIDERFINYGHTQIEIIISFVLVASEELGKLVDSLLTGDEGAD